MIFCRITLIVLMAMSVGMHLAKHGERRNDKYNFWYALFGAGINLLLLWGGGFFN